MKKEKRSLFNKYCDFNRGERFMECIKQGLSYGYFIDDWKYTLFLSVFFFYVEILKSEVERIAHFCGKGKVIIFIEKMLLFFGLKELKNLSLSLLQWR